MAPILARYGPFFLYSYTVVLGLGLAVALAAVWQRARSCPRANWTGAAIVAAVAGLLLGRLVFVAANADYFRLHPSETWQLWRGGLAYHGVLVGALGSLWVWARQRRVSFTSYADLFAPAVAVLFAAGWLACWLEGCAYGRETTPGMLGGEAPDTFGVLAVRFQTQTAGLVLALGCLLVVWLLRDRLRPGQLFWVTLALLSSSRAIVGLFRGDLVWFAGSLPVQSILDLAVASVAVVALLWLGR